MISRTEVAKLAGVSEMTVTRVVSGKGYVAPSTRTRVQSAIDKLNYIPNKIAANLVTKTSNTIAILIPDLTNPYYLQLVDCMIEEAKLHNHIVTLFKATQNDIEFVLEDIISNRVCAVVNMVLFELPIKYVNQMRAMGVKIIHSGIDGDTFNLNMDYCGAMKELFEHFKQTGEKDIIFLAGFNEKSISEDKRVFYYRKYMKEYGFGECVVLSGDYPKEESYVIGYNMAKRALAMDIKIDACICLTDMMAFGAINCFSASGKKIPEDISVVGFDDLIMSKYFNPPLTSIRSDIQKEANYYVKYIINEIDAQTYSLDTSLILRSSCK